MRSYDYDIVIIGGGSAGLVSAKLAHGLGKKVLLIERTKLGGECTWTGCVPSKTLIHIAHLARDAQRLQKFGIHLGNQTLNTSLVMEHVRNIIEEIYSQTTPEKLEKLGIKVLIDRPTFIDKNTLQLRDRRITAKKFIIATGSHPAIPPLDGLHAVSYLTNESLFSLRTLPRSFIIIGGGPIGIEMASALNNLGIGVTVLEINETILPREDKEIIEILSKHLTASGVILKNRTKAVKVTQDQTAITVNCVDRDNKAVTLQAEALLIAAGRKPNIEELGLEKIGVETTPQAIKVNSTLQTTIPTIYACGDVVGPYQFSHMAEYQASIATRNACVPFFKKRVDYKQALWVTFCDPELATAGFTEEQARSQYKDNIHVYRSAYENNDRAHTDSKTIGLAKIICDAKGYIIGAHVLGARAGEIIHELQLGKYYNIKLTDFYAVIHAYPTYSEVIWQASKRAYIENLKSNFWLRILSRLMGHKTK